jgi:hypothetical protein
MPFKSPTALTAASSLQFIQPKPSPSIEVIASKKKEKENTSKIHT